MLSLIMNYGVLLAVFVGLGNALLTSVKFGAYQGLNKNFEGTLLTAFVAKLHRKIFRESYVDEDTWQYGLLASGASFVVLAAMALCWPLLVLIIPVAGYYYWVERNR